MKKSKLNPCLVYHIGEAKNPKPIKKFLGIPFWEHVIAPFFNFVVNDLFGALISGSGLLGGFLFAFSYLLFGIYFLFFLLAGGYLAAKLCLRLLAH